MPCSICRQAGHNRSTCPQRGDLTPIQRTQGAPPGSSNPNPVQSSQAMWDNARARQSNSSRRARRCWKKTIKNVINLKRYASIVNKWSHLGYDDPRIYYPAWLKVKDLKGHPTDEITTDWEFLWRADLGGRCENDYIFITHDEFTQMIPTYQCVRNACFLLHRERNPLARTPANTFSGLREINLVNLRDENYLVYWVVGNYMVQDIDSQVNNIKFMGLSLKTGSFPLKTMTGHRFYLVPHRLDIAPPYHPQTDKEFFIEPYLQINIHDGTSGKIYIDDKDNLSELNKWKFNALKLDFLIREVIKLGGKNNDLLECVLDLHDDIKMDSVNDWLKDIAGIPSTFTNIT